MVVISGQSPVLSPVVTVYSMTRTEIAPVDFRDDCLPEVVTVLDTCSISSSWVAASSTTSAIASRTLRWATARVRTTRCSVQDQKLLQVPNTRRTSNCRA